MAALKLSDISAQLVTPENPARDAGSLDYHRCALLHNFLVEYSWVAEGHQLADLERRSYFERHGAEAEQIRGRLEPSLTAFLEAVYDVEGSVFYFWVEGISTPSMMWANHLDLDDESGYLLTLYPTNVGICGHSTGLMYDQRNHKATMALGLEDVDFSMPYKDHLELWHPLETVLSNWVSMIQIGKITASPDPAESEKYGPWTWHSYGEAQIDSTVAAFDQLVETIESRMPVESLRPSREGPLLSGSDLDAASVPKKCFVREFLTRVRVPRFEFIAPGLLVPLDPEAFVLDQAFTIMDSSSEDGVSIPPVLLFRATHFTANFDTERKYESLVPFCGPYKVEKGDYSVPAGLYSESIQRSVVDNAEEGFRLILPFRVGARDSGARKSDGHWFDGSKVAELFQHGFKPFGGEWWRAQRLERLFGKWTELVERGVWDVDRRGVVGTVEKFRDADKGAWRDYYIEPSW